jgi:hypothetical protein
MAHCKKAKKKKQTLGATSFKNKYGVLRKGYKSRPKIVVANFRNRILGGGVFKAKSSQ